MMQSRAWEKKVITIFRIVFFFGSIFLFTLTIYFLINGLYGSSVLFLILALFSVKYFILLAGKEKLEAEFSVQRSNEFRPYELVKLQEAEHGLSEANIEVSKHFIFYIGSIFLFLICSSVPFMFYFSLQGSLFWLSTFAVPIYAIYLVVSQPISLKLELNRLIISYPFRKVELSKEQIVEVEIVSSYFGSFETGYNVIHLENKKRITLALFRISPSMLQSHLDARVNRQSAPSLG